MVSEDDVITLTTVVIETCVEELTVLKSKAVDVEDVIAVYNFSKSDAVAARKQPDVYERFIDDLEFDRQMAIAWSKGDPASRKPDYWEYWKEREGLSEPVISDRRTEGHIFSLFLCILSPQSQATAPLKKVGSCGPCGLIKKVLTVECYT